MNKFISFYNNLKAKTYNNLMCFHDKKIIHMFMCYVLMHTFKISPC